MKTNKILLLILLPLLLGSCSKWLDVSPEDQVNGDKLFETGDGYRNALHGVYLELSSPAMYGREMTWGFMDVLGQHYFSDQGHMPKTGVYSKAVVYNYVDKDVKSLTEGIWSKAYNAVANCNNLILHVESEDPLTFARNEEERSLIWGEALALRAFIHFDILRLFAPALAANDGKAYVPYYERYGSIGESNLSVSAVLEKVERDLLKARDLVAVCDTAGDHKKWHSTEARFEAESLSRDEDIFFTYRGYRMNYYAITALLARVYAYGDRLEEAAKMAEEVINATYPDGGRGDKCFEFTDYTNLSSRRKSYDDLVLAFANQKLNEDYINYTTASKSTKLALDYEVAYENSKEDQRGIALLTTVGADKCSNKYLKSDGGNPGDDMIPVIRLAEMYYIVAEYYYRAGRTDEAVQLIDFVRINRGISAGGLRIEDWDSMQEEILKEVRKELVGEGQLFFYYKRMNVKPTSEVKFVCPLPDNELIH